MRASSGRLHELREEWNSLVPLAAGLPRVHFWRDVPSSIREGEARLTWLRAQLASRTMLASDGSFGMSFGVEMESILPDGPGADVGRYGYDSDGLRRKLAERLNGLGTEYTSRFPGGIAAQAYRDINRTTASHWKLVPDLSVEGGGARSCEAVSPILHGEAGFENLRQTAKAITEHGNEIKSTCGLHVHVGIAGRDYEWMKRLIKLYASYESVIDQFMPKSRRGNAHRLLQSITEFARRDMTPEDIRRFSQQKFRKLNLQNAWSRRTVEFRHHGGTTDPVKIEHWVRLVLKMVKAADKPDLQIGPITLEGLMNTIEASQEERDYYAARVREFERREHRRHTVRDETPATVSP